MQCFMKKEDESLIDVKQFETMVWYGVYSFNISEHRT